MSNRIWQTIDTLRTIEAQLRDVEAVLKELDDSPADAADDRVFTKINHDESTNRVRLMVDCHLSRAPGLLDALKSNCKNLADHYLPGKEHE